MGANKSGSTGKIITGHMELVIPSKYLKSADLHGRDVNVVIDHVEWEDLVMQGGKRDRKPAIHIRSVKGVKLSKLWVVGKTVLRQIGGALGETDVGKWAGGKVTMYPTTCKGATGGIVECIRVRGRANARADEEPTADMMKEPEIPPEFIDEAGADEPASDNAGGAS